MKPAFIKKIKGLEFKSPQQIPNVTFDSPVEQSDLLLIEKKLGTPLNGEYKTLITELGSIIELEGDGTNLNFLGLNEILEEEVIEIGGEGELQNIFVFGVDNGGYWYFYDVKNFAKKGHNAIFLVYPGNPFWEDAQYIGKSLQTVFERIIEGEDFSEDPYLELNLKNP